MPDRAPRLQTLDYHSLEDEQLSSQSTAKAGAAFLATVLTSLYMPRVYDRLNPHSRMGSSLSGHPFAGYRDRCSRDSAPKDPQDCRDERPEMNSTQTASLTEHPEPVVAPQRKDEPDR